jgi:hypothetical protein
VLEGILIENRGIQMRSEVSKHTDELSFRTSSWSGDPDTFGKRSRRYVR